MTGSDTVALRPARRLRFRRRRDEFLGQFSPVPAAAIAAGMEQLTGQKLLTEAEAQERQVKAVVRPAIKGAGARRGSIWRETADAFGQTACWRLRR